MKVSKVAFGAAMMAGGSAMLFASPASAQRTSPGLEHGVRRAPPPQSGKPNQPAQQPGTVQTAQGQQYNLTPAERAALTPLLAANNAAIAAKQAGQTPDWAAVQALLPAAQAAAVGPDAQYLVAKAQLGVALGTNNNALQLQALDALIASTVTPQAELTSILNARASRAFDAQDFQTSERMFARLLELNPNDERVRNNLSIVRQRLGNTSGAAETLMQTIQAGEASGQLASEDSYRRALALAYTARDRAKSLDLAARLARAYPTGRNWRDATRIYHELARPNATLSLDAYRLARAAGALEGEADYLLFAQTLDQSGLPGETKAVIEEGIARRAFAATRPGVGQMLSTANRRINEDRAGLAAQTTQARNAPQGRLARAVADALYGYGRYAEAADLYRVAATKTGEDRNLLNLRLGASLAMAGQRAEAETALRAVSGESSDLAKLWLAWLARRQG
jgi:Flp pilus assembly protein TadD